MRADPRPVQVPGHGAVSLDRHHGVDVRLAVASRLPSSGSVVATALAMLARADAFRSFGSP